MRLQQMINAVRDNARRDQNHAEGERTHPQDRLLIGARHCETEKKRRRNADGDGAKPSPGNPERTRQIGLAESQDHQRRKLQQQARAIKKDVERDQPGESQAEAQCPARCQRQNRNPGRARLFCSLAKTPGSIPSCAIAKGRRE
jgi:hypothetical protein